MQDSPEILYIDFVREDTDEKRTKQIIDQTLSIITRVNKKITPHIKKLVTNLSEEDEDPYHICASLIPVKDNNGSYIYNLDAAENILNIYTKNCPKVIDTNGKEIGVDAREAPLTLALRFIEDFNNE